MFAFTRWSRGAGGIVCMAVNWEAYTLAPAAINPRVHGMLINAEAQHQMA
jgi:hypothetical protein